MCTSPSKHFPLKARLGPGLHKPLLLVSLILQASLFGCSSSGPESPVAPEALRFDVDPELIDDRLPILDPAALEVAREDELTALRDASSYTFRRADGSSVAVAFAGPVNYPDDLGRWRPIDTVITEHAGRTARMPSPAREGRDAAGEPRSEAASSDHQAGQTFGYAWSATANNPRSYFPADPREGVLVGFVDEGGRQAATMLWSPIRRVMELESGERSLLPVAAGVVGRPSGNKVRYAGTYPGVVEEYEVQPGRLKHDIVLLEPPEAPGGSVAGGSLSFEGLLSLSSGLTPYVDGSPRQGDFVTTSPIELRNASGEVVFRLARPIAYEKESPKVAVDAEYRWTTDEKGLRLALAAPLEWLLDPARSYPLVIDPTPEIVVSASYSVDTAGASKWDTLAYNDIGRTGGSIYRAAFKFPLDSVDSWMTVTSLSLQLDVTQSLAGGTWRIGRVASDPVTAAAATIHDEVGTGTEYLAGSTICQQTGIRTAVIDGAITDVQAQIDVGGWIALGIKHGDEAGGTLVMVSSANAASELIPRLIITYTGPPQEAFQLQSPAGLSTGVPTVPVLTWTPSTYAWGYRVAVTADPAYQSSPFADPSRIEETSTDTTLSLSTPLSPYTDYWWNVRSVGSSGDVDSINGPWSFTTGEHPVSVWRGDLGTWDGTRYAGIQAAIDSIGGADVSGWSVDADGNAVVVEVGTSGRLYESVLLDTTKVTGTGASRRFTLRAEAGYSPVIEYSESDVYYVMKVQEVPGVTIEGLEVINATSDGTTVGMNIQIDGASDVIIRDCVLSGSARDGLWVRGINPDNARIIRSIFRDNLRNGLVLNDGTGHVVRDSVVHRNGNRGIGIQTGGVILENNLVYDHNLGDQINVFTSGDAVELRSNTLSSAEDGIYASAGSVSLRNNIVHDHFRAGVYRPAEGGAVTIDYNCWWENLDDLSGTELVKGAGDITASPLFVDALAGDYHLLSEHGHVTVSAPTTYVQAAAGVFSPCIDAGDPAEDPSLETHPNGGRINIGAYGGTSEASVSASDPFSTIVANPVSIPADGASTSGITVQAYGGTGTPLAVGGSVVCLRATAGTLSGLQGTCPAWAVEAADQGNGTYTATLTSETSPDVTAVVYGSIDSLDILDTAEVVFVAVPPDPTTSTLFASPASITADGSSASTITVQAMGAGGSPLGNGGALVCLSSTAGTLAGSQGSCGTGEIEATDNGDGTYAAQLTSSTSVEMATVSGTMNGEAMTDTASVDFVAGAADHLFFTGQPSTTVAGALISPAVQVEIRDSYGNLVTSSLSSVALTLSGGDPVATLLGTTTVAASGGVATFADLSIQEAGVAYSLGASSGTLTGATSASFDITPGVASEGTTTITAAPTAIEADASSTSSITVQVRDSFGNELWVGGDVVCLATIAGTLSGVQGTCGVGMFEAQDGLDGTYTATLTASSDATETALITGTVNGAAISDSAQVDFVHGAPSAATTTLSAIPIEIVANGASTSALTVQVRDSHGNYIDSGGDLVCLHTSAGVLSGSVGACPVGWTEAGDQGNGSYTAILTSSTDASETATVSGTLNGSPIAHTVVDFVPGPVDPSMCTVSAADGVITADGASTTTILVRARDAHGNPLLSGGEFVCLATSAGSLSGAQGACPAGSVEAVDQGDGTYAATLTASTDASETATVTATVSLVQAPDTAVVDFVPGPADPAMCTITASDDAIVADGSSTTVVTVRAFDAYGNPLESGGALVCLATTAGALSGLQGSCAVGEVQAQDVGDGSYVAVLTASTSAADTATISGTLDGVALADQATVDFIAGSADPATTQISAVPPEIVADGLEVSVITVQAIDSNGNALGSGGDVVCLTSSLGMLSGDQGSCNAGAVEAAGVGLGAYSAELSSTLAGTAEVTGTLNGAPISSSVSVELLPGAPWVAEMTGPAAASAGDVITLSLQIVDAHGNAVPGASTILATVSGTTGTEEIVATSPVSPDTPGTAATLQTTEGGTAELQVGSVSAGTLTTCVSGAVLAGGQTCHDLLVSAAAADHLSIFADPAQAEAGEPVTLTLQVLDVFGNDVAQAVSLALVAEGSGGGAPTLNGSGSLLSATTNPAGLLMVELVDTTAEVVTIRVQSALDDQGDPLPAATPHDEAQIPILPGPPHHAVLVVQDETVAGQDTPVEVQLVDAYGNQTAGETVVCVTAAGEDGGEPAMGPFPEPGDLATACVTTDAGNGGGALVLTATKAEPVRLLALSSGLPGSGGDDEKIVLVVAAAQDHLRVSALEPEAYACEPFAVQAQIVDSFDNPVESSVLVTLRVEAPGAPDGEARILETDLAGVDPASLPAAEVSGETDALGRAQLLVALDAQDDITLSWTSADLPADPAGHGLTIAFYAGTASAALSEIRSDRGRISVSRSTTITVLPRDACGIEIGPGAEVVLDDPGQAGILGAVVDEGDGTYTALFTATTCLSSADIGAEVDGIRLDSTVVIEIICLVADPDLSTVATADEEAQACASHGVGARIAIILVDEDGEDLGPDFPVEIEEDDPYVLAVGEHDIEVDPVTGQTVHMLTAGSNRCSGEPRAVYVNAGGVRLTEPAWIVFSCPPVDSGTAIYRAEPASAAANGIDPVRVTVFAADTCGNPAFGRAASLSVTAAHLEPETTPESAMLRDAAGAEDDATTSFELRSRLAGESGVVAEVDGVTMLESANDLVTFDLEDVLSVNYQALSPAVVAGQTVVLTAVLRNHYGLDLTDLVITAEHEGLKTLRVEGAQEMVEGWALERLEPDETLEIRVEARVSTSAGKASSTLSIGYRAQGVSEPNVATSATIDLEVWGQPYEHGCECGSGSGASAFSAAWAMLLLLALGRAGRDRRRERE